MSSYLRNWEIKLSTFEVQDDGNYKIIDTRSIKELRIVFNIRNTLLGDPSLGNFQMYNISPITKGMLASGKCILEMYTSYGTDEPALLYKGEVTNTYEMRENTELIQQVWVRDSGRTLETFLPTIPSYETSQTQRKIIEDICTNSPEITGTKYIGSAGLAISNTVRLDDYVCYNTFKEELDELLLPLNLYWHVEFGVVRIINGGDVVNATDTVDFNVSRFSGLLTRPVVSYVGTTFSHLISTNLQPDRIIDIDANTVTYNLGNEFYVPIDTDSWKITGKFRVMQATHRGDTRGDKWQTDVKAFYRDSE